MNEALRISVAMATYNGQKFILEQLESLAQQTLLPYELVISDDGSTDDTLDIIAAFAETAPFLVRVFTNPERLGFVDNFFRAAMLCEGDWIAFCDQDDVWKPRKLERIDRTIASYKDEDLVLVGHTSLLADEALRLTGQCLPDFKRDRLVGPESNFAFFCIVGFSMAFHRKLIREFDVSVRPTEFREVDWTPPGHDQWLGMLANIVGKTAYIAEPLAIWRRHGSSLTRPPLPQSFIEESGVALRANARLTYALRCKMAEEAADVFSRLAKSYPNSAYLPRLHRGERLLSQLSTIFGYRCDLYSADTRSGSLSSFAKLLMCNAYFGNSVYALGWRSFLKDFAYTFGLMRVVTLVWAR